MKLTKKIAKTFVKKNANQKENLIAYRKSCKASGTGLSHYILMDTKK